MKKIPIINENDLNALVEESLKNEGVLTTPTEYSQMLINVKGVSINNTPRKDGRYQGYIIDNGIKRYIYGKTKEEVAIKIKEYLKNGLPKKKKADTHNGVPTTFNAFAMYFFENFRKKKVAELTYVADIRRLKKYIIPAFNETPLKKITPKSCQDLIDKLSNQGKGKTADELYSLMSIIFKGAIKHGILTKNPLDIIYHQPHERNHGKALTLEEESFLKTACKGSEYELTIMTLLYTGLRPNELETAYIDGPFIIAKNSKRKNKKIEYKKIPIIKALSPFVVNGLSNLKVTEVFRRFFKSILPNHKIYDLRTTFYSKCKELGVSDPALNHFVGHSLGTIGNTYTDLSDEYLIKEAKKLDLWK